MIIVDYGNETIIANGVYIDYGLVQARIDFTDIIVIRCSANDMYDLGDE